MQPVRDLALGVVGAAFLMAGACAKTSEKSAEPAAESAPAPGSTPIAAPSTDTKTLPAKQPEGPTGSIEGKVSLLGSPPEMPKLSRGSDTACDKGVAYAETILADANGGLANVVVRIKPGTVPAWTPSTPIVVDQVDCLYRPRVQGGVRGQTVEVHNSDATTHNVHARYLAMGERTDTETLLNRAQPPGVALSFELGDEPVAKLRCNNHSWMTGYVVVSDNPYFGVTAGDGSFHIDNVPVGTHSVEVWHEFYGVKEATLEVLEGVPATLELSYDAVADNPLGKN